MRGRVKCGSGSFHIGAEVREAAANALRTCCFCYNSNVNDNSFRYGVITRLHEVRVACTLQVLRGVRHPGSWDGAAVRTSEGNPNADF